MRIENSVNSLLNKVPLIKRIVKRIYQLSMYLISPKIKSEGDIEQITPDDGMEYFFGYYDKSPWDKNDRYMLCLRVKDTTKFVAPNESAEIILIDTNNNNEIRVLGKTNTWNVQQGSMLQWLGPDFDEEIIYNDFQNGKYCSIILNINTRKKRVIHMPIYTVSSDGKFALTLDFSRLHRLRPGYGYSNLKDKTKEQIIPQSDCIWKINLKDGDIIPILKYTDFMNFETREEMQGAEHKVNHLMLSPSGKRFMVLHRWIKGSSRYTRLVTVNSDGTEMYNLSDDNMASHCNWKNDKEILGYLHKDKEGNGYFLMKDKTKEYSHLWPELTNDGHPSYSPDGKKVVTDTYPNRARLSTVYVIENEKIEVKARVFAPFKYDNEVRCDLHPRWDRKGDFIAVDSVYKGKRGLYRIAVNK